MIYKLNDGTKVEIDEIDLPLLEKYSWQSNDGYIFRSEQINRVRKRYYLHREILNAPSDMLVDHKDGNPRNNKRSNIRLCTQKENNQNRRKPITGKLSSYKGVKPRLGKYEASIGRGKSYQYLGTFESEEEAAIAYNDKAVELFGEFANLNDIPEEYQDLKPRPYKGTSDFRGVMFHKRIGKWQASIQYNKKRLHLGYFDCEREAALAYNKKASKLLGYRAKLNVV